MKTLLFGLLTLAAAGFAHEREVSLSEVGEAFHLFNEASSFVVKVKPGDTLPLNFAMSGDVLRLENAPQNTAVKALQPMYVKIEPNFLFSTDKKEWKSFESFFTGQLNASVGSNGESSGEISLTLKKR